MEKTNYTTEQKKTILIYCGELAIFSVVLFTIYKILILYQRKQYLPDLSAISYSLQ